MGAWVFLVMAIIFVSELAGFATATIKLWKHRTHHGVWILTALCAGQFIRILVRFAGEANVSPTRAVYTPVGLALQFAGMGISAVTIWAFVAYLYGHWAKNGGGK